ncbi:MAG: TIGR02206 family membrane protein [Fidelibacterota bacterium]
MNHPFVMFSAAHFYVVVLNLAFGAILIYIGVKTRGTPVETAIRLFLVGALWFIWVYLRVWRIRHEMFSIQEDLPIHLCGFSSFLVPIMLLNKDFKFYEVMYYWGLGGATQSLLTPTVEQGFPHFLFFEFFFTHALIITGVLYATFVFRYQPTFRGLWNTWLFTAFLLIPIGIINHELNANYFFIAGKPDTASLLDILGPWPWYLISLSGVAFLIFVLCWLPFFIMDRIRKRKGLSVANT